ncbi:MAG: amidohydrolase [Chloroflexi bacterium]|nr:amidohydrolase [Chloroflexota bacterium]
MIVDAHNHIWDNAWPPIAPDVLAGQAHRFLHHMDQNGVDMAVVVCHLDEHDPENNTHALAHATAKPDRFAILANVHLSKPDALDRIDELIGATGLVGVSYYLPIEDSAAWMTAPETARIWERVAEAGLAVNLGIRPNQIPGLRAVAARYPSTPFLICHNGLPRVQDGFEPWRAVLEAAERPNIYVKVSGFAYPLLPDGPIWEYPYVPVLPYIRALAGAYGAERLMWGSDYPPTMRYMTYRQSMEVIRTHCTFLSEEARKLIMGDNATRVLRLRER